MKYVYVLILLAIGLLGNVNAEVNYGARIPANGYIEYFGDEAPAPWNLTIGAVLYDDTVAYIHILDNPSVGLWMVVDVANDIIYLETTEVDTVLDVETFNYSISGGYHVFSFIAEQTTILIYIDGVNVYNYTVSDATNFYLGVGRRITLDAPAPAGIIIVDFVLFKAGDDIIINDPLNDLSNVEEAINVDIVEISGSEEYEGYSTVYNNVYTVDVIRSQVNPEIPESYYELHDDYYYIKITNGTYALEVIVDNGTDAGDFGSGTVDNYFEEIYVIENGNVIYANTLGRLGFWVKTYVENDGDRIVRITIARHPTTSSTVYDYIVKKIEGPWNVTFIHQGYNTTYDPYWFGKVYITYYNETSNGDEDGGNITEIAQEAAKEVSNTATQVAATIVPMAALLSLIAALLKKIRLEVK